MNFLSLIPMNNEEQFTDNELQLFEAKYLPTIKNYAEVVKQKKAFEQAEKKFKAELEKVMSELKVKTVDCPFVKFTRVEAGDSKTTVDLDALKNKEPELYEELLADYPKVVKGRSAYVKFDVK